MGSAMNTILERSFGDVDAGVRYCSFDNLEEKGACVFHDVLNFRRNFCSRETESFQAQALDCVVA